jgi:hypothetical protein
MTWDVEDLLTTETRRAQRELYSCPIGRRRSGKRSQPCGHDLVHRRSYANGWSQAKELSPQAEALFPGRRLPAREKTTSSVYSVPLWYIFNSQFEIRNLLPPEVGLVFALRKTTIILDQFSNKIKRYELQIYVCCCYIGKNYLLFVFVVFLLS